MIIDKESPLRKIPMELDIKEAYFIDSIRLCVEIIDISYFKLYNTLLYISKTNKITVLPFLYSWTIIDFINRFVNLLKQMPRLNKKLPVLKMLFDQTINIRLVRNKFQHIEQEISKEKIKPPFFGIINWLIISGDKEKILKEKKFKARSFYLMPGKMYSRNIISLDNPPLKKYFPTEDIQYIMITVDNKRVNFTDILISIEKVIRFLEQCIDEELKKYNDLHYLAGDILITTDLIFNKKE